MVAMRHRYTSRPSFTGPCKLAADVYRAGCTSRPSLQGACKLAAHVYRLGTHGRVPAMVGILMAHVGREFAGSRALRPHVYRREACPVHFCPQFTRPPRTGGRRVPRGRPPGTRPTRVSCGRANSAQECTGTGHRPHSRGPSLRRPCKLGAGVYPQPERRRTHPDRPCGIVRTRGRRVPPARMARGARSSLSLDRRRHARRKDLVQSRLVQHGHPKLLRLRQLRTRRLARDDVARALRY